MDDLHMMMGDDSSVYQSPSLSAIPASIVEDKVDDVIATNSTNEMLDVSNKKQRKGNRRHNNNQRNKNRHRVNSNNQNDGTSFDGENNPINIVSTFNRTNKIYNKLRKNDAVKVIDTPSGRAGFVYQSSSSSGSNSNNQDFPMSPSIKESNNNWEDSYSQNQYINRNANDVKLIPDDTSNKKIMPVLTSDGKIALVVRGDTSRGFFDENQNNASGNSVNSKKYEPITNLTSIITALNSNNDNNNFNHKQNDSINMGDGSEIKTVQEQHRLINRLDEFFASVTNKVKHIEEVVEHELGIDAENTDDSDDDDDQRFLPDTTSTTTQSPFSRDEDEYGKRKDLLLIDRPLSEILGLPKKTHYQHPQDFFETTTESPYVRPPSGSDRRVTINRPTTHLEPVQTTQEVSQSEEFDHESPEVINIAVIPGFDSEMEERLFGKNRDNIDRNLNEIPETSGALSSIHCAMQAIVAVACAFTVFGVLGAYYKIEIVNQIRIFYW